MDDTNPENLCLLKLEEIYKTYYSEGKGPPVEVLKNVSLEVEPGQTLSITGASGEGKSTLLHLVGLLDAPNSGEIKLWGKKASWRHCDRLRNRHIGFVFQFYHLVEDMTVLENVLMPAMISRDSTYEGSDAYNRAIALIDDVGLMHRLHFKVQKLSGGEKQRVCIARSLINNPDIILADEPTGNLDHKSSGQIIDLLFKEVSERKKALILVTHEQHIAERCQRHYMLSDGQLILR